MGGFIAQTLAATAPARVSRLVLLSTDHGGPRALRAEARVWEQLTDHGGSPREQASRLISLLFHRGPRERSTRSSARSSPPRGRDSTPSR